MASDSEEEEPRRSQRRRKTTAVVQLGQENTEEVLRSRKARKEKEAKQKRRRADDTTTPPVGNKKTRKSVSASTSVKTNRKSRSVIKRKTGGTSKSTFDRVEIVEEVDRRPVSIVIAAREGDDSSETSSEEEDSKPAAKVNRKKAAKKATRRQEPDGDEDTRSQNTNDFEYEFEDLMGLPIAIRVTLGKPGNNAKFTSRILNLGGADDNGWLDTNLMFGCEDNNDPEDFIEFIQKTVLDSLPQPKEVIPHKQSQASLFTRSARPSHIGEYKKNDNTEAAICNCKHLSDALRQKAYVMYGSEYASYYAEYRGEEQKQQIDAHDPAKLFLDLLIITQDKKATGGSTKKSKAKMKKLPGTPKLKPEEIDRRTDIEVVLLGMATKKVTTTSEGTTLTTFEVPGKAARVAAKRCILIKPTIEERVTWSQLFHMTKSKAFDDSQYKDGNGLTLLGEFSPMLIRPNHGSNNVEILCNTEELWDHVRKRRKGVRLPIDGSNMVVQIHISFGKKKDEDEPYERVWNPTEEEQNREESYEATNHPLFGSQDPEASQLLSPAKGKEKRTRQEAQTWAHSVHPNKTREWLKKLVRTEKLPEGDDNPFFKALSSSHFEAAHRIFSANSFFRGFDDDVDTDSMVYEVYRLDDDDIDTWPPWQILDRLHPNNIDAEKHHGLVPKRGAYELCPDTGVPLPAIKQVKSDAEIIAEAIRGGGEQEFPIRFLNAYFSPDLEGACLDRGFKPSPRTNMKSLIRGEDDSDDYKCILRLPATKRKYLSEGGYEKLWGVLDTRSLPFAGELGRMAFLTKRESYVRVYKFKELLEISTHDFLMSFKRDRCGNLCDGFHPINVCLFVGKEQNVDDGDVISLDHD